MEEYTGHKKGQKLRWFVELIMHVVAYVIAHFIVEWIKTYAVPFLISLLSQ